jgi:DNA-binding beta-propeller fold protein YncE
VGPQGEAVYVGQERINNREDTCEEGINVIAKFSEDGERLSKGLNQENSTSVGVDLLTGNVYVGNVNTIAAYQSDGSFIERFGLGDVTRARAIAVNAKTDEVYVADFTPEVESADRVEVFEPAPAGAPSVDSVSSENLAPKAPPLDSARLQAEVDPNGHETEVRFEYGTVDCASQGASCTSLPAQHIGPAFGDQPVSAEVTSLQPGTRYFFRAVATSACGLQSCTSERSGILNTVPASSGLLADNRAWELVSPPEKDGAGIEAIGGETGDGPAGGIMQAATDGNSVTYTANAPVVPQPEGSHAPEGTQVLSNRTASGWASQDLATAQLRAEGLTADGPQEYRLFSQDLSAAILRPLGVEPKQEPPLVSGLTEEEKSIYVRHNATCQSSPTTCFQALLTAANRNGNEGYAGAAVEFLDATPDLSYSVFESEVSLKVTPTEVNPPGLYEWHAGRLELVSRLPGNTPAVGAQLGEVTPSSSERNTRNAISSDGSRVFFSNEAGNRIYMRDTVAKTTVQVNSIVQGAGLTEPPEEEPELDEARYQTASVDGSHVFFKDTARLTADSSLAPIGEGAPADLYGWVPQGVEGCSPTSTNWSGGGCLTDLTAHSEGRSADVQGLVIGVSEDGTYVYFVANGALTAGAQAGNCSDEVSNEACSLYVAHLQGGKWETRLIAVLSGEDSNDWVASGFGAVLGRLTSRVSPNGQFLAFMSDRPLTGYENIDKNSGARDEEVFLYDLGASHLTCASCKSGSKPEGVLDTENAGEGVGLLVDRPKLWRGRWLAGNIPGWTPLTVFLAPQQSRYLSNDGRLYFNSPEQLAELPAGEQYVHKENVYQYEPNGLGNCAKSSGCVTLLSAGTSDRESAFIDASPSGNDVFFVTSQQLLPQDRDQSFDLYDARVCTDASPCLPPESPPAPPCSSEASCRPPGTPPPTFGSPGSTILGASGNTAQSETRAEKESKKPKLTRKQLLAKALKKCRTKYKGKGHQAKKRRATCEKQARRKYGAKHKAKHSSRGKR